MAPAQTISPDEAHPDSFRHPQPDAERVDHFARRVGLGRTLVYRALNTSAVYRDGLPFLPSFKAGRCRRIRLEAGRRWLAELEARSCAPAR